MLTAYAAYQLPGRPYDLPNPGNHCFYHPSFCLFCVVLSPMSQGVHFTLLSFVSLSLATLSTRFLDSPLPAPCFWVNFTKLKLLGKEQALLSTPWCSPPVPCFLCSQVGSHCCCVCLASTSFFENPLYLFPFLCFSALLLSCCLYLELKKHQDRIF